MLSTIWLCLLFAALIGWLVGWLWGRLQKGRPAESLDAELAGKMRLCEDERNRLHAENATLKGRISDLANSESELHQRIDEMELLNWNLKNIVFPVDSAEITSQAEATLDEVVPVLKRLRRGTVEIGGHTDNINNDEHNRDLSQRRADAVRDHLTRRGVPPSLLRAVGYGASHPVAENTSDEGRQRNRRIEFRLK